ncbi:MAG TPA: lipase family protein [Anaerolineales bacterium]|nr:lipase family protein [Anaerolineales bacterium]
MAPKQSAKRKRTLNSKQALAEARSYFKDNDLLLTPPIRRAAYSDRMAWVLASMSHLVYDRFEDDKKTKELLEAKLEGGGFKLIKTFNSKETDTQAFLVSNGEYAVLAFRGTEVTKREDVKTDIQASLYSIIEGRVHTGFIRAYKSLEKEIEASLEKVKDLPLYITGHSLGAAIATIATQYLERNHLIRDRIAACYTYGSPRVGNHEFDREFRSAIYRIVNTTDIVTIIPLLAMGYIHIGDVRFLERKEGMFRRGVPLFQRILFFLGGMFRLFGPWVGDHAIVNYRDKLRAVARNRNMDLFMDARSGGKF